jgi:hypothetical protein
MVSNAGAKTMQLLRGLKWHETNYIAATAYDSWGLESDYSDELAYMPIQRTNIIVTVTGNGWIESSQDLKHWTPWPSANFTLTNPTSMKLFFRGDGLKISKEIR